MYPVHPSMVFSTDDTTLFVFEGQDVSGGEKLGSDSESGSIHGHFTTDTGSHKSGLRVRVTVTMCAGGFLAPLFLTVTGQAHSQGQIADRVSQTRTVNTANASQNACGARDRSLSGRTNTTCTKGLFHQ